MFKIAFSPLYHHPLPAGHRFPMEKYRLLPEQLLREGIVSESDFFTPTELDADWILKIHEEAYWEKLKNLNISYQEERRTGFPLSAQLIEREITIAQGSLQNTLFALSDGVSFNIAGGTHHAYADRGEGFCLLNDIAIAAQFLLTTGRAQKILVIDLDVHQGNGTAKIFENEDKVFTFSMHGANNYPLHKEKSNLDISLPDGTEDDFYLQKLDYELKSVLDSFQPDFAFYQSGVDVLATDKLGRLALTQKGCKSRDLLVFQSCMERKIPVSVSMGGGYSQRIADIVDAHVNTFKAAAWLYG